MLVAQRRWNLRLKNGLDVTPAGSRRRDGAAHSWSLSIAKRNCCRATLSSIDLRLPDRVTVRLSDEAAQAREDVLKPKTKKKGRRRMNSLHYGVTPKMKPVSRQAHALSWPRSTSAPARSPA